MEEKFKKTEEIIQMENEIETLNKLLLIKKETLQKEIQNKFDKQFGLVIGKTVLTEGGKEYIYAGLYCKYSFSNWVLGYKIKRTACHQRLFVHYMVIG